MPIDPNEAPEGMIAVEHSCDECPGEVCLLFGKSPCQGVKCHAAQRKDKTGCYFIKKPQPTEANTMEDEYEYLVADSVESCKTLADWFFNTSGEIIYYLSDSRWSVAPGIFLNSHYRRKKPQTDVLLTDPEEIARGILAGVVECTHEKSWSCAIRADSQFIATKLGLGLKYRLKPGCKLPPKKTKKLVPRTAEEFWPLIGKWWCRREENKTYRFLILNSNGIPDQENWEIAPLGTEEWQPMCKEIEVEE